MQRPSCLRTQFLGQPGFFSLMDKGQKSLLSVLGIRSIDIPWIIPKVLCTVLTFGILAVPKLVGPALKTDFPKGVVCTVTFYSPCPDETDDTPYITASGARVRLGICAVSRDLERYGFTFGKSIYVEGLGSFEVQDRMHRRWQKRVDILVMHKSEARRLGKIKDMPVVLLDKSMPS